MPPELGGLRLDQALARLFPQYSRNRLQAWVRAGRVTVDAGRADVKRKVWGGERIALSPAASAGGDAYAPQPIALQIVHEDDAIIVIDKPAGLVVHPGAGNPDGTLPTPCCTRAGARRRAARRHRAPARQGHERPAGGGEDPAAQTDLVRQLAARTVKRVYLALVHGDRAGAGEIDAPIGRDPRARTRMAVTARGKPARTRYRVVERFAEATLVAVGLDTGRTHQIRVHFHAIGHPIVGDPTYRGARPAPRQRAAPATPRAGCSPHSRARRCTRRSSASSIRRAVPPASGAAPLPGDMRELIDRLRR